MYFSVLFNKNNNKVFAVCPVQKGNINRCADSSRYFVLKIEDILKKKHIFIGVAFEDRNKAFDFNVAVQDSKREQEHEQSASSLIPTETKNYSLKEGETIHITIPTKNGSKNDCMKI